VPAGYGKVAVLDELQSTLQICPDRIVYVGDGRSDVHVMLHVNRRDGLTIAVSEANDVAPLAKRTVLMEDHETLAYEDKEGAQVCVFQQASTHLWHLQRALTRTCRLLKDHQRQLKRLENA
jgi:3-deoxy-D-manno-octulosonate 8-phosphate phosphatase KdsC-like HAD superfamily phosphatase